MAFAGIIAEGAKRPKEHPPCGRIGEKLGR